MQSKTNPDWITHLNLSRIVPITQVPRTDTSQQEQARVSQEIGPTPDVLLNPSEIHDVRTDSPTHVFREVIVNGR